MEFAYKTKGTCSTMIVFNVEDNILKSVRYQGGCNGNLQGIFPPCGGNEHRRRYCPS